MLKKPVMKARVALIRFICSTNVLERYHNVDVTLTLPEGKKLSDIKWLAVYDLTVQVSAENIVTKILVPCSVSIFEQRALAVSHDQ